MEQGKTELFSGLQLDKQQCSWSPSKTTKRKNSTEQTELESQVKQSYTALQAQSSSSESLTTGRFGRDSGGDF